MRSLLPFLLVASLPAGAFAASVTRSAAPDNLNLAAAWNSGVAPTGADVATWDLLSATTNTLGANLAWGGLDLSGASGDVIVSGGNTLTAGAVNLGTHSLTVTTSSANNSLSFSSLTGTGNLTVDNSTANLGMTAFNTANALNFNGTLTLRGGNATTAVGTVAGSFFYLGRTGITQAAGTAFALDTGASATNAKDVVFDASTWGGQTVNLTSLSGYGAIRSDSGGVSGQNGYDIAVTQNSDSVFNGLILSHAGTGGQIRTIRFTKSGSGVLTLAGLVGKQTASGGASNADIDLVAAGGTLKLTANNTRTGTTVVGVAGTLEVAAGGTLGGGGAYTGTIANAGILNFTGTAANTLSGVVSGTGVLSKSGSGTLTLAGANTLAGDIMVSGGTLVTGNTSALGTGTTGIGSGATLQIGNGTVNTVTLGAGAALVAADGAILKFAAANAAINLDGGSATLGTVAGITLDLGHLFDAAGVYHLIAGGTVTTAAYTLTNFDTAGYSAAFADGTLTVTAVPEPSVYGLLGAGALVAASLARRRR